ncbi:MAG: hypothetical protein GX593_00675 [Actinomycetales bacterium]|nr:hypothetical protein [Actinomycetales bacterium]
MGSEHAVTSRGLDWHPALDHPALLAPSTAAALRTWAEVEPAVAREVLVAEIDPGLADTATLTEAFGLELDVSCNCVLVSGRRAGEERLAGVVVRATTRADVNNVVRRLLDVRKATFLPVERAVEATGMEYGGITPVGLPEGFRVLIDARVRDGGAALVGSGVRRSKLVLPGELLARLPGVEVVEGLALD